MAAAYVVTTPALSLTAQVVPAAAPKVAAKGDR
jgi:hypothetical protein